MKSASESIKLILEDGTEFIGNRFGAPKTVAGEVVFNTGMTGYIETLTDPSYKGQILVLTHPLIGNYGVPPPRPIESLEQPFESNCIQVQGLIVQNYVDAYSHHAATRSLSEWLRSENISAVTGIDTRTLTRRLREYGTMGGLLCSDEVELDEAQRTAEAVDMREEVFFSVAPTEPLRYTGGDLTIMVVDVGTKDNIVRSLLERGATVVRVPWHSRLTDYAEKVDGIVIGNGPGDPKNLMSLVEQIRVLMGSYSRPIFGICLGNQILALAADGDTYKLAYGHRGINQPVQDLLTRQCFITSQNHGYAVKDDVLPRDWEPWFLNINDGTNEGIRSRVRPFFGVQFHPEASPGPRDTGHLFDDFLRLVGAMAQG